MKGKILFVLFSFLFLISCSALQESETENSEENKSVYIFDDVSVADTVSDNVAEELPLPSENIATKVEMYIIQVGAFSTLEKAENFINSVKDTVKYDLTTHFSEKVNLYVIQLLPFRTREEAEKVRDELRTIPELNGTFIVPSNK